MNDSETTKCLRHDIRRLTEEKVSFRQRYEKEFEARCKTERRLSDVLRVIAFFFTEPNATNGKIWNEKLRRLRKTLGGCWKEGAANDMTAYKKVQLADEWAKRAIAALRSCKGIIENEALTLEICKVIVLCPSLRDPDDINEKWEMPKDWEFPHDYDSKNWKKRLAEADEKHRKTVQKFGFSRCPKCKTAHTCKTLTCRECEHHPKIK